MNLFRCGLAVALAAVIVAPPPVLGQGLMVTGYADFEANFTSIDADNSNFFFDNHHFNLILIGDVVKDLYVAGEVEYEHAGEEIALEYAYFGYTGIKNLRIMAGKFIVPFGRFNKDLHPTIINKMPDRPHGFSNVLPQTYNDVGLWVSGTAPLNMGGTRVVWDGYIVNGLMGDDGGNIRDGRDNDRESRSGERDDNKAVGARLGLELAKQGVDFGVSVYRGNFSNDATLNLDLTLIGADAAFRHKGLELRGEVVHADQEATAGDLSKTGGYLQAAYMVTPKWEPVVRYSMRNFDGESDDLSRLSFGLNFYVQPASSIRVAYHKNMEESGFEVDNDAIVAQWNVLF
ncbi:MAG TPA: porin [Gemmatimonadales bacterium]|nr:porin [Gemmatimonadales bacterium]